MHAFAHIIAFKKKCKDFFPGVEKTLRSFECQDSMIRLIVYRGPIGATLWCIYRWTVKNTCKLWNGEAGKRVEEGQN